MLRVEVGFVDFIAMACLYALLRVLSWASELYILVSQVFQMEFVVGCKGSGYPMRSVLDLRSLGHCSMMCARVGITCHAMRGGKGGAVSLSCAVGLLGVFRPRGNGLLHEGSCCSVCGVRSSS